MVETVVKIDTFSKVKEFCSLCSLCEGEVDVCSDRHIVSGKSLMGLYSLDLSQALKVNFHGNIPNKVKEEMKKFIVG